jgi:hypothetical protein
VEDSVNQRVEEAVGHSKEEKARVQILVDYLL